MGKKISQKQLYSNLIEAQGRIEALRKQGKITYQTAGKLAGKLNMDMRSINAVNDHIDNLIRLESASMKDMKHKRADERQKEEEGYNIAEKKVYKHHINDIPNKLQDDREKMKVWVKKTMGKYLISMLKEKSQYKMQVSIYANFYHPVEQVDAEKYITVYHSRSVITEDDIKRHVSDFDKRFEEAEIKTIEHLANSGWVVDKYINLNINIFKTKPFRGKKYMELPKINGIKMYGILNIKNDDDRCFQYCMWYHQKGGNSTHEDRVAPLKKYIETNGDKYDWTGINFPVSNVDIDTFEKNNDISVNVFEITENEEGDYTLGLLRRSRVKASDKVILLHYEKDDNSHYVYVNSLMKLMRYKKEQHNKRREHCKKCFKVYIKTQEHKHVCNIDGDDENFETAIEYVESDHRMKFEHNEKALAQPFICYADFEAFCEDNNDSKKIMKHKVNSYAYKIVCTFDDSLSKEIKLYRGEDAVKHFLSSLLKEKDEQNKIVKKLRNQYKDHNLSDEEEKEYQRCGTCHICEKEIKDKNEKVRDHCHLTGKYRGAAHSACNISYCLKKNIMPVIFHNLRSYDGHFIIQEASEYTDKIIVIAQSFEKYMSFSFMDLKFMDSFQYLSSSLEELAKNLSKDDYKNTDKYWGEHSELMRSKGIYPYEYVKNHNVFSQEELPRQENFYSSLTLKGISTKEYLHGKQVWNAMKCKTFGDYHDIYLKTDVLLLTDVFENFRKLTKKIYKLEATNYYGAPGLAWDAMLRKLSLSDFKGLGAVHDDKMRKFFEDGKRGGLCMSFGTRKATANNKYTNGYSGGNQTYLSYLDMNNLYGKAMCDTLPEYIVGYVNDVSIEDILGTDNKSEYGYYVKVDVNIRDELKNKCKGYPLFPETRAVEEEWISDFQRKILKDNKRKFNKNSKKLLMTLYDKKDYVCHYRYLKYAIEMGFKAEDFTLKEVIKFKQSEWLKPYIDMNTTLRAEAQKQKKAKFEQDFYKLMNNIIYGKTNENILNHSDFRILKDEAKVMKAFSKDNFKECTLSDDLFFIQGKRENCIYDRPIFVGCSILDLSKIYMGEFYYNYMQKTYKDNFELLYTDTDSFVFKIVGDENIDYYQDMYDNKEWFDLSESANEKFKDSENMKVVGKMKCETNMRPMKEFISLCPKSYSFVVDGDLEKHIKCKGVTKAYVKKTLLHQDYSDILETGKQKIDKQCIIRSLKHQLYTIQYDKIVLSAYDDKCYRINENEGYVYGL